MGKKGIGPVTVRTKVEEDTRLAPVEVAEAAVAAVARVAEAEDGAEGVAGQAEVEEVVSLRETQRPSLTTDCYKCGQPGHWANACPDA